MILLDTDTVSLLFTDHARVLDHMRSAADDVAITIITWIEILRGRFDAILKSANGSQLQQAQQRLRNSQQQLATLPIITIDASVAEKFEQLLRDKGLKKLGRGDLLIASIALAHRATLVTRNLKDFRRIPGMRLDNWAD